MRGFVARWIGRTFLGIALMAGLVVASAARARAEEGEWSAGVTSGALFPAVASQDATAFRLTTWMLGGQARYGLVDDLDLTFHIGWAQFAGETREEVTFGRPVEAVRVFAAQQFEVRAGARYKWLGGYDFAPYVEAGVGYQWTIYGAQDLRDPRTGQSFGLDVADVGQGGFTLTLGAAGDWRVFNLVFVGLAIRVTEIFGAERYQRFVTVPLELSVYW